jgi:TatD DNase family protein
MGLVDSHCHLDFEPLGDHIPEVIARAGDAGVEFFLCVSVNLEDYPRVIETARRFEKVFASVGVHPNEREGREPDTAELVDLGQDPRVVAVGETGLDYFRSSGDLDWQRQRFARHIAAARSLAKPLIIHTRDAGPDTIAMLRGEGAEEAGGVMHCFADTWEIARGALDLGFYISFSGILTFKSAENLREVARRVPAERVLVETDSPYLAPVPHRGKTNEPAYVRHVAETLAEVRGEPYERIVEQTTANFFQLFSQARQVAAAPASAR